MEITVRDLIEHLAQFEGDDIVMIRDQKNRGVYCPIYSDEIQLERIPPEADESEKYVVVIG